MLAVPATTTPSTGITSFDQEYVTRLDLVDGNRHQQAVLPPVCDPGCPLKEMPQLTVGTRGGIAFEYLPARQHQPDDGASEGFAQ